MLHFGLKPITFDENGVIKTHLLSHFWLKRLRNTPLNGRYVLTGEAPKGYFYRAFFNSKGEFMFVTLTKWTNMLAFRSEIFVYRLTEEIAATGRRHSIRVRYRVSLRSDKTKDYPWKNTDDFVLHKDVACFLRKNGYNYMPEDILVEQDFSIKSPRITIKVRHHRMSVYLD